MIMNKEEISDWLREEDLTIVDPREEYVLIDVIQRFYNSKMQRQTYPLGDVWLSLPSELEAHEQATKLYQDEDYGDAKYDGYMKCYRELVKGNKA